VVKYLTQKNTKPQGKPMHLIERLSWLKTKIQDELFPALAPLEREDFLIQGHLRKREEGRFTSLLIAVVGSTLRRQKSRRQKDNRRKRGGVPKKTLAGGL